MKLVTFPELRLRKGIPWTRQHVSREERAGRFPKRVRIGHNSIAWVEEEVDDWVEARIADRECSRHG